MKKLLLLTFALAAIALAGPPITQGVAIKFVWDHEDKLPVQVFESGVFWRSFGTNEIFAEGTTNGVTTFSAVAVAPKGGREYRFTIVALDTNGVPSDPSNVATQYFRVNPPGRFGVREK
jgi:hypothetical protein